jgi:hypothetical protein
MAIFNTKERLSLTQMVLYHLSDWGVSDSDQVRMLALPSGTRSRAMRKYRDGQQPLPDEADVYERIEHLLGIADALRTSYPRNESGGRLWMTRPNDRFEHRKPVDVMVEDDLKGILEIRMHLDCSYDWAIDTRHQN